MKEITNAAQDKIDAWMEKHKLKKEKRHHLEMSITQKVDEKNKD